MIPFLNFLTTRKESILARKSIIPQLSEIQKTILLAITKRRDSSQHLVRRVRAILFAADGQANHHIATQVELCQETVRTWRKRWNAQQTKMDAIEVNGNEKALREFIVDVVLADDPS